MCNTDLGFSESVVCLIVDDAVQVVVDALGRRLHLQNSDEKKIEIINLGAATFLQPSVAE
jgi:hypothetical protein